MSYLCCSCGGLFSDNGFSCQSGQIGICGGVIDSRGEILNPHQSPMVSTDRNGGKKTSLTSFNLYFLTGNAGLRFRSGSTGMESHWLTLLSWRALVSKILEWGRYIENYLEAQGLKVAVISGNWLATLSENHNNAECGRHQRKTWQNDGNDRIVVFTPNEQRSRQVGWQSAGWCWLPWKIFACNLT